MLIEIEDSDVLIAHRLGRKKLDAKSRVMVVKCSYDLRNKIFGYTKNLKDKKNESGDFYRVSSQLPKPLYTQAKEKREKLQEVKKLNATLDEAEENQSRDETWNPLPKW